MSEARRFAKNYIFMVIGYFMNFGVSAVTMLFIGWGLEVADFGVFTFAMSLTGFVSVIGQAGTGQYAIAYIPRNPDKTSWLFSASNGLRAVMALPMLAVLLAVVLISDFPKQTTAAVMMIGVATAIQLETMFCRDFTRAVERNYLGTMIIVFRGASNMAGVILWYLFFQSSLYWLVAIWLLSQVPAMYAGVRTIHKNVCPGGMDFNGSNMWAILRQSYLFGLVSLFMMTPGTVETILLKYYVGGETEQIGYFQIALRLIMLTAILTNNIEETFKPVISRKFGESPAAFRNAVGIYHKFAFITGLPCFVFVAIFAREILQFLFGTKYLPAVGLVQIIALGAVLRGIPPNWSVFHMTGLQKHSFHIAIVTAVAEVVCAVTVFPFYGMWGAAWVVTAVAVINKLQTVYHWLRYKYPIVKSPLPLIVCTALTLGAAGLVWLGREYYGLFGAAGLYFILLVPANWYLVMDQTDRRAMKENYSAVKSKLLRQGTAKPEQT